MMVNQAREKDDIKRWTIVVKLSLPSFPFPSQSESRLATCRTGGQFVCHPGVVFRILDSSPILIGLSPLPYAMPLSTYSALMPSSSGAIGGTSAFDERTKRRDVVQRCHRRTRRSIWESIHLILRLRDVDIAATTIRDLLILMSSLQE